MWWKLLSDNAAALDSLQSAVHPTAQIAEDAVLDGSISVGENSKICRGAFIQGPVSIGANCLIGNNAMIRGPLHIGDGTKVGYAAEIKNARIGTGVSIGPMCYVADSVLEDNVYLGAMVRTSNHRLDRAPVSAFHEGKLMDTGLEKLGAFIGSGASLGIQVIILPGRIVAPGSVFGPRITIEKNLPSARYVLRQELSASDLA